MTKSKGNYSRVPNKRSSSYIFFQKFSNSPALISFYFIKISNPSWLFRPPSPRLFDFTWWSNPPPLIKTPHLLGTAEDGYKQIYWRNPKWKIHFLCSECSSECFFNSLFHISGAIIRNFSDKICSKQSRKIEHIQWNPIFSQVTSVGLQLLKVRLKCMFFLRVLQRFSREVILTILWRRPRSYRNHIYSLLSCYVSWILNVSIIIESYQTHILYFRIMHDIPKIRLEKKYSKKN